MNFRIFCLVFYILFFSFPTLALPLQGDLKNHVEVLSSKIGERNVWKYENLQKSLSYINNFLKSQGYEVILQTYLAEGKKVSNIIVEIKGDKKPDEIVVVGAHYDSVAGSPGADDNASGVAALLELAKFFSKKKPARTLRFVAFVNEEPPFFKTQLMGSLVYAKMCRLKKENIVSMLSLETIAYYSEEEGSQKYPPFLSALYPKKGNFLGVVGNIESKDFVLKIEESFKENSKIRLEKAIFPDSIQGISWSDHWSFWQEKYPNAVMITDTALFRNPHYHKETDTAEHLNFSYMAEVLMALEKVLEDLVNN